MTTSPYPGEREREREIEELARSARGDVVTIGKSLEGRDIRCVRVPSTSGSTAPDTARVLVSANIHGPEWIGSRTAFSVLERMARNEDDDARDLRARAEVWVLPCINVDGFARVEAAHGQGTLKQLRTNANGVDLNRNFPLPSGAVLDELSFFSRHVSPRFAGSGSSDPKRATYRGTGPLSEPETRALSTFCGEMKFVAAAGLHSFMGTCIPPCVTTSAEARAYASLARAARRAQTRKKYWTLAWRTFDVFTGELEDHLHHAHGTWAMTIECFSVGQSIAQHVRAPSLFWRFNPHAPKPVVDNDAPAVIAFLRAALDLPHPRRT